MPAINLLFYKEADGRVPLLEWLDDVLTKDEELWTKCRSMIGLFEKMGSDLRRPHSDGLRDGIRELRIRRKAKNYRLLFFYSGSQEATLSHCFLKVGAKAPDAEIDLAVERKLKVAADRDSHVHKEHE